MGLIYRETVMIKGHEVDKYGRLSIPMLVRLLLYVSKQQTNQLENSQLVSQQQLAWFIVQHDLTIYQLPRVHDTVMIETEALAYNKFFTYRRFKVVKGQTILVETLMKFAIVNMETRKLARIAPEYIAGYQAEPATCLPKLTKVERIETFEAMTEYTIGYTDIDMNQHVNNAVYLEWIWNSLPQEYHVKQPKQIAIVYENEAQAGKVQHYFQTCHNSTQHLIKTSDVNLARAILIWDN